MRSYKCENENCKINDLETRGHLTICPFCKQPLKRIWCSAVSMNGHGYKNNFGGKKR